MLLLSAFRSAVELIAIFFYIRSCYSPKRAWGLTLVAFSAVWLLSVSSSMLGSIGINLLFTVSTTILLIVGCFECGAVPAVFHGFILTAMIGICEFVPFLLLSRLFPAAAQNDMPFLWLNAVLSKLLLFVCGFAAGKIAARRRLEVGTFRQLLPLSVLPVATCVLLLGIYEPFRRTEGGGFTLALAGAVLLLAANIVVLVFYDHILQSSRRLYRMEWMKERQELDYRYFESIEKSYGESRILIHDIKNHLLTLRALAADQDYEKLTGYLDALQNAPALKSRAVLCDNRILNAVLTVKRECCEEYGITFDFENTGVSLGRVAESDLCAITSNLLDNAIEAARDSIQKEIFVSFFIQNGAFNVLMVKNTCRDKPAVKGGRLLSQKPDPQNHGIGLFSVEKTVARYRGTLHCAYHENEGVFTATVVLPISEEACG